jgi:CrcB protein
MFSPVRTLWIGTAGFFGAVARYRVDLWVGRRGAGRFPWGTMVVNVTGCFLLGLLLAYFTFRFRGGRPVNGDLRAAVTVGFVGAYTTFSTYARETLRLGNDGDFGLAFVYGAGSVVLGLVAVGAGSFVGRSLA